VRRRDFITGLVGLAASTTGARAQRTETPRIGYLTSLPLDTDASRFAAFRKGLGEIGYVEPHNVTIEYRSAENQSERLRELAAELIQRRVAVIATIGGYPAALAAKALTMTIPIVFQIGADPVKAGLVVSLNRPDGNLTGMTNINPEILPKRFQLLCELVPLSTAVGWLWHPQDIDNSDSVIEAAGRTFGRQVVSHRATDESDIDSAFDTFGRQGVKAVLVSANPFLNARTSQIVALASRQQIATSHEFSQSVVAGGLMSYGSNIVEQCHEVGVYAGRILKGERPADLPVLQPTKFELVINLKTAKTLGLTVPETLLATADEVIQ
jgi:putative tryptophan/tyrosine transport system substrate-binding protein